MREARDLKGFDEHRDFDPVKDLQDEVEVRAGECAGQAGGGGVFPALLGIVESERVDGLVNVWVVSHGGTSRAARVLLGSAGCGVAQVLISAVLSTQLGIKVKDDGLYMERTAARDHEWNVFGEIRHQHLIG